MAELFSEMAEEMAKLFSEMAEEMAELFSEMAELFSEMAARWLERKHLCPILCKLSRSKNYICCPQFNMAV